MISLCNFGQGYKKSYSLFCGRMIETECFKAHLHICPDLDYERPVNLRRIIQLYSHIISSIILFSGIKASQGSFSSYSR